MAGRLIMALKCQTHLPMLLTISITHQPATDLGFLLPWFGPPTQMAVFEDASALQNMT